MRPLVAVWLAANAYGFAYTTPSANRTRSVKSYSEDARVPGHCTARLSNPNSVLRGRTSAAVLEDCMKRCQCLHEACGISEYGPMRLTLL